MNIGLFDPITSTYTNGPVPRTNSVRGNFSAGVMLHDGRVLMLTGLNGVPNMGVYNPSDNTFSFLPLCSGVGYSYSGWILLSDGRMVLVP